jgi:hypothetical protein
MEREKFWLEQAESFWQNPRKQQKAQSLASLFYSETAVQLNKINFKSKASSLHWEKAPVIGAPRN